MYVFATLHLILVQDGSKAGGKNISEKGGGKKKDGRIRWKKQTKEEGE
jgi:hypothetical protein